MRRRVGFGGCLERSLERFLVMSTMAGFERRRERPEAPEVNGEGERVTAAAWDDGGWVVHTEGGHPRARAQTAVPDRYKRPFDLALLTLAAVLLAPFWLLLWACVALAIRVEDGGPVYHVQCRVGRGGRLFDLFKFRTMRMDAERLTGPVWASKQDSRVTRVGAVLRRYHLDELPQVFNVFRGEMSLVGPRPERPEIDEQIVRRLPEFAERLRVRPGIAGLAQARGGYHAEPRQKLRYDRLYIERMGAFLDVRLLVLCMVKALASAHRWVVPRFPGEPRGSDGLSRIE